MVTFHVKRVPFDFHCPPNAVWSGYNPSIRALREFSELTAKVPGLAEFDNDEDFCYQCINRYGCCGGDSAEYCIYRNPDNVAIWRHEPPKGDGFQVWTDYSFGPISPVLSSFEEVCEWMEENASQHTQRQTTKDEWAKLLIWD